MTNRISLRCGMMLAAILLTGCATKNNAPMNGGKSDAAIQASLVKAWSDAHPYATEVPTIDVSHGLVTLTGTLASAKDRIDAVREAWQPDGVAEVVNELEVLDNVPEKATRRDLATTIKLRTKLTFDTDVASTHYSIETLNGTVYLMGAAHDEAELARVKQLAEDMVGKGKVVAYIQIRPIA